MNYGPPQSWTPPEGEALEVTALRRDQAIAQRRWLQQYVNDPEISTTDLMSTLSKITYDDMRELVALSLRVQCNCVPVHDYKCPFCELRENDATPQPEA